MNFITFVSLARRRWLAGLILLPWLTAARPAHALECAALGEQDAELRLQFIRQSLRDAVRLERRFAASWSITYVGLAGASWVLVPLSKDPRQNIDAAWNSAKALAASVIVLIEPLQVARDQRRLERLLDGTQPADPCTQLAQAEYLLAHAASSEARSTSVLTHLGSLALNIGLGLALGYGLDRPASAAMGIALGTAISEVMMATRPTLAVHRLASYRAGDLRLSAPPAVFTWGSSRRSLAAATEWRSPADIRPQSTDSVDRRND